MSDVAASRPLENARPIPDLETARKMAWEAHRLHVAGRAGRLAIGIGGFAVILGLLFILTPPKIIDSGFDDATAWALIIAVTIYSALLFWLSRHTRRSAVAKDEPVVCEPPIKRSFWYWFVPACLITSAAGIIVSNSYSQKEVEAIFIWVISAFWALFAIFIFWHSFKYRLWEHALMAGGCTLAGVLILLFKEAAIGWATFSYGFGFLIGGLFLHLRWRSWVKALPKNETQVSETK